MRRSAEVAVLGAGPAGLAAGLFAAQAGHEVVVIERAPVVGGLAGSFEVAGVRVDHGSHRLHPSLPFELRRLLDGLLGDELQVRPRHGRIRLGDRWVGFPLRPLDLARHAPPTLALGATRDLARGAIAGRRAPPAQTFAAQARAGVGPAVSAAFYEPYASKIWGIDATELSAELYRRRVSAGSTAGLVRRVLRGTKAANRTFLYPAGGFGRISEVLSEALTDAGGTLLLGQGATGLAVEGGSSTIRLASGDEVEAGVVLSTLPARSMVGLMPSVPPPVLHAVERLQHRGAVLVYLALERSRYTSFDAHYFPDVAVPMARISEPKGYRQSPADPPDRTVLCAELPATVGDDRWTMSDDELGASVSEALARVGLPDVRAAEVHVRRVPFVYPVYQVGYERHQQVLEDWAAAQPGLLVLGRQALFAHDNTHHALMMGHAAAACLRLDGTVDVRRWSAARGGFRAHVVED